MVSTVALDTNIITALLRGEDAALIRKLQTVETLFVPLTVYAEVLAGLKAGANPRKYIPVFEEFLQQAYVEVNQAINSVTVTFYAEIYAHLKKQGTPVSPNDIWIAAECAQNGHSLYTFDKDFDYIPQILKF